MGKILSNSQMVLIQPPPPWFCQKPIHIRVNAHGAHLFPFIACRLKWHAISIEAISHWLFFDTIEPTSLWICPTYRKVASSSLSWLVAHFQIFRRLMKGKFDAYALWPLTKKLQNWIVDRSTARDFTVDNKIVA